MGARFYAVWLHGLARYLTLHTHVLICCSMLATLDMMHALVITELKNSLVAFITLVLSFMGPIDSSRIKQAHSMVDAVPGEGLHGPHHCLLASRHTASARIQR